LAISSISPITDTPGRDNRQEFSQTLFRTWPYWPVLLISIIIGLGISWVYLRYATPFYESRAQIVVNDNAQDKDNNLNPAATRPEQRFQLSEVEKQTEIIQSKEVLKEVVKKLQLYTQWSIKRPPSRQYLYSSLPVTIELATPDSLRVPIDGDVKINTSANTISFNGHIYPSDSVVNSPMGKCRWHFNPNLPFNDVHVLYLKLVPVSESALQLQKRFVVSPVSKQSAILDLSITDEVPERAEKILTTIIDTYGSMNINIKKILLDSAVAFIDDRLNLVSRDLSGAESSLENYKSSAGITDLTTEGQIFLAEVKDNDKKINEIEVQLSVLQQIQDYLSKKNRSSDPVPATLGLTDQVLVTLLNQLFQDQFELERLLRVSGENNPNIKILKDRIEQRKQSILQSVTNLRWTLEASLKSLKSTNAGYGQSLKRIPEKERSLVDINRNKSIKSDLYTFLLQRREETAIAAAAIAPNYRIIEIPENYGLQKPRPLIIYLYGAVGSLLLAGLFIYKKEFGNRRILYRSEIEKRTTIPIVGEIIYESAASKNKLVVGAQIRSLIAEQFRELRTNINFLLRNEGKGRVLLMTSSVPKEGKSFISMNLAMSLALSGVKTALVEFDLYKPQISLGLGVTYEKGLADYFKGECSLDDICIPYEKEENLWIVPSGTTIPNPAELILNGRLPALIEQLRQKFDYIVLDSPCVGIVSDPKILAAYASLSLYIIRQNYSHHGFVKFMNELGETGVVPNIKIIFNGIKIKKAPGLDYWDTYGYNGFRYGDKNGYTEPVRSKKRFWSKSRV
jgi:tyrosine-protein kinase Etk/Wzc